MKAANRQGPARSPTVLETPSADSVKAEAHWAIVASEAPEQTISSTMAHSSGCRSSRPGDRPSPSATKRPMGQVRNRKTLTSGTSAHSSASTRQRPTPNTAKNSVEPRMTPTAPQQ